MKLVDDISNTYNSSPGWADLIPIQFLFNESEIDILSHVQIAAEHGAHVLYPRIQSGEFNSMRLVLLVTLDTAILINSSLMVLAGIADSEMGFREEVNKTRMSKKRITH